jgi:DNA-directed RNA polymerase subunit K/omega
MLNVNTNYLELAKQKVSNIPLLINIVSRRVRQLNQQARPMVKADTPQMSNMDIALKEIAEGKMSAEIAFTPTRKTTDGGPISL